MVGTTFPIAAFAMEGDTAPQTPTERTITAFDELGEDFSKSVPFDGYTYIRNVALNTPFEELKLPTELAVTVENTTITKGEPAAPSDTEPAPAADEPASTEPVAEPTDEPAAPSDAEQAPLAEEKPNVEAPAANEPAEEPKQDNTTVTETTQEKIPVTWKGDKEYTPAENSTVIYTAVLPDGYALADSAKLPTINVMVGTQAIAAMSARAGVVQRTTPLDLTTTNLAYTNASNQSVTANPQTTSITDSGEGWSWNHTTKTLTLSGVDIDCSSNSPVKLDTFGIKLNLDCHIVLTDGTVNNVKAGPTTDAAGTTRFESSYGVYFVDGTGSPTISGTGTLNATGSTTTQYNRSGGIGCNKIDTIITISEATINASSVGNTNGFGICGSLDMKSGTVTASGTGTGGGYGIYGSTISISDGTLTVSGTDGGKARECYGIFAFNLLDIKGGILNISASKSYNGKAVGAKKITANGAAVKGATVKSIIDGTTTELTQADLATPIVIQFVPSISFDARNGLPIDAAEIKGGKITLPAAPTWNDYTFVGWFTDIDGKGTPVTADNTFDASAKVYAKWTKNGKTVRTEELNLVTPSNDQGWTWDSNHKILTLDGVVIDTTHTMPSPTPENHCGINLSIREGAKIILTNGSENFIKVCTNPKNSGDYSGINAYYGLIIDGEGSLNVEGDDYGIAIANGAFTMNSGNVTVTSRDEDGDGICVSKGITITGGMLSASVANPISEYSEALTSYGNGADSVITATGATVTGETDKLNGGRFVSGTTKKLKQSGAAPVVFSFGPSIAVGAQSATTTYGTVATPTFTVTGNSFGDKYPAFAPSIVWTTGTAPTGVATAINNGTITVTTTAATPAGEHKFKVVSAKADTGNYESAEATLKVDQFAATIEWGATTSFPYNGKSQAPTATVTNKIGSDDVTVTVTGGQINVGDNYTATANGFGGTAASNYAMPTPAPTQKFAITKAAYSGTQAAAPSSTPASKTATSITLNSQTIGGETVEYGYCAKDGDVIVWSDSTTINSLTSNKEYYFYARVKGTTNHDAGTTSAATKIKTDLSDANKVTAAVTAVSGALKNFTATNATDAATIVALVEKALTDAGITGVNPTWNAAFQKTKATESNAGSITGSIKLTCGTENNTVALSKTIEKLPSHPVDKINLVEAAINAALNAYTATNATTDADIATIVNDANTNSGVSGVIVSWGTPVFKNINSTNAADGKVTGTLDLTCTSGSTAAAGKLSFDLPIKRSDAQKLADAKTKAETALAAMTATNATIADDVLTAVNNALSGTGAVATWKTNPSDFNKTLATDSTAGSITGSIVVTFNGSTSDVAVKLTITKLIADKTVLNNTITDANNAKNGISINNSPDTSSVLSGTMYVSDAEMKALTDAITAAQAVLDKTNPSATDAELTAAATALNNAVNTFKAVIKTGIATSLGSNGSGAGGGSSSGNGNTTSSSTVGNQKPTNTATPTKAQTNVSATVDKNGNASATVNNKTMQDAINKAKTDAQKNGTSKNDVSVTINVNTGGNGTNAVKVNLPKTVQDTLVKERVAEFEIQSETANLSFDDKTLQSIQKQAGGDVTVNASKTDVSKLSKEVRDEIGNRPVYDLSITGPSGKIISDFDGGSVTVSIPYKLQPGENPNNVQAYFIDAKGEAFEVTCTYDSATQSLVLVTNHFSIYAIGYNENAPKFNDVANHWAKNDIEFVTARGLLAGTGNNVFAPDTAITNGNFAKALTKLAGKDMSGLVKGDKNKAMTRQEMAEIMVQFAKTTGYTLTQNRAEIKFTDTKNEAVKTMQMAGVIMAKNGSKFDPQGSATKAEVSAMLHRYIELLINSSTAQGFDMNDSGKCMYYENGKAVTGKKKIGNDSYTFNQYGEVADAPKNLSYGSYTVKNNDNFWKIAKEQKCNMFELAKINGKTIFSMIHPGDVLQIPQQ